MVEAKGQKCIDIGPGLIESLSAIKLYLALERLVTEELGVETADEVLEKYREKILANWDDRSPKAQRVAKALLRRCRKERIDVSPQSLIAADEREERETRAMLAVDQKLTPFGRNARWQQAQKQADQLLTRLREQGVTEQEIARKTERLADLLEEEDKNKKNAGKVIPFRSSKP